MFELDLAAIGLEYIGTLYGHCLTLATAHRRDHLLFPNRFILPLPTEASEAL